MEIWSKHIRLFRYSKTNNKNNKLKEKNENENKQDSW